MRMFSLIFKAVHFLFDTTCDDEAGDLDDFDADDFETVFDHESGSLEVVR